VLLLALGGCTPLIPPSLLARHDPVAPDPIGTVSLALVVGLGGEVFGAGAGVELRALWQATSDLRLGVGLGGGMGDPAEAKGSATRLLALRGFGRYNPGGADWGAVDFGLGLGGLDTGLRYLSIDGGFTGGHDFGPVEPHLAAILALSLPLVQGRPVSDVGTHGLPTATWYLGLAAGVNGRIDDNAFGVEIGALSAHPRGYGSVGVFWLSAGDRQALP
jgi:hypothetical protein